MSVRVAYLCLQATRQGQASYAHVHEICDGLELLGFRVSLFEPTYADESRPRPGVAGRLIEFVRVQGRFVRALGRSEVAYVRDHPAALPAMLAARLRRVPIVLEVNGPWHELIASYPRLRRLRGIIGWLFGQRAGCASAMIAVTPALAAWLRSQYGHPRVEVVANGANIDLFNPSVAPMRGLPERYVTFFGALAPWQGIQTIISAVMSPWWPQDMSVVIAGEGQEAQRVREAAIRDPRIVMLGRVPYDQVPAIVVGGVAGLCPKTNTGADWATLGFSPLKAYEILACGVPAIVSDFPGLTDLVLGCDAGEVVAANDPKALAEAVGRLADHVESSKEKGARGRACIVREHSWKARAQATAAVIRSVVA